MKTLQEIASYLRQERSRTALSQAEFAARAGIPFRSYQRLESGDPGAKILSLLRALNALGVELSTAPSRRPTLDELTKLYGHEEQ